MSHFKSGSLVALVVLCLGIGSAPGDAHAGPPGKTRPAAGLVSVKTPSRAGGAIRLRIVVKRRLNRLAVKVNGRDARLRLDRDRRRVHDLRLDALHGVRYGRNRITVRAVRGAHRQTVRRTVRVRGDAPLVGIKVPRRARQHEAVRLDARATRARAGGRLRFRWRIVAAPRRAHARLSLNRGARPRLVASHPGRYLVALTVRQATRGAARSSAAGACAVNPGATAPPGDPFAPVSLPDGRPIASTPLDSLLNPVTDLENVEAGPRLRPVPADRFQAAPRSAAGCTTQYVAVEVEPASGPIGIAFDSMATVGGRLGMRVGASFFPTDGQTVAVYLDADTLEGLGSVHVPPGVNAEAWATVMSVPYTLNHEVLILLTGPGFSLVKGATESDATAISNESLVEGDGIGPPGGPGQIQGWFQHSIPVGSTDDSFRLVDPDRITVDTGDGTAPTNTMTIGNKSYSATLPEGTEAGFMVVVTDPALRPILGTPAFFRTNTGIPPTDAAEQAALAELLARANATTASTVLMQSIGSPRPTTPASLAAGQQIERLGGSEWMFLSLDGSGGYALIGNTPPLGAIANQQPAAEASAQWTRTGTGTLQGLLKRRHDGAFRATLADAVGSMDFALQQVAFQPPVPWPETDTPGKRAAGVWIAQQLGIDRQGPGLCSPTPQPDVRAEYCNLAIAPGDLQGQIRALSYTPAETGFTESDFTAVRNQLLTELGQVKTVRAVIEEMQAPFALENGATAIAANQIAANVIESIPEPPESPVSADLGLTSAILYAAAEVPVVGEAFGPIAAGLDIASDLTEDDGVPSPDWDIETSAANAGTAVDERLQTAYEALGDYGAILVSDSGRLTAADQAAKNAWGQDPSTFDARMSLLRLGVEQWLYTAIVPSAYDLVEIPGAQPGTAAKQVHCVYSSAPEEWRPWLKADPSTMFFPLNDWTGIAPVPAQMMAMLHGFVGNRSSHAVKSGSPLVQQMFGDPLQGGAGLVAPWFYDRGTWTVKRPKMVTPSTALKPGVCGLGDF